MSNNYKSPLHEMACTTPTEFWNDSCSVPEIKYALEYGAVGATTNPVIVLDVIKRELPDYLDTLHKLFTDYPDVTEDDIAWLLIEHMACKGAVLLTDIYEKFKGQKGRLSIQVNSKLHRSAKLMTEQAIKFHGLAQNLQVKMPMTKAGIAAVEEATFAGVSINATVSFSVPQAIAVAEAVERGLARRKSQGLDSSEMHPVCTIMIGRVDDWLKIIAEKQGIIVDPICLEMAGVAVFKRAYRIYKERGYRTQLLVAAYRNHHHWSEFIGGDVSQTIPHKWIKLFNASDVACINRMDNPVDDKIIHSLTKHFPDFVRAYEPNGMAIEEFDGFGPTVRTLHSFHEGYDELLKIIRKELIKFC